MRKKKVSTKTELVAGSIVEFTGSCIIYLYNFVSDMIRFKICKVIKFRKIFCVSYVM